MLDNGHLLKRGFYRGIYEIKTRTYFTLHFIAMRTIHNIKGYISTNTKDVIFENGHDKL